jgi:hypothetical protein
MVQAAEVGRLTRNGDALATDLQSACAREAGMLNFLTKRWLLRCAIDPPVSASPLLPGSSTPNNDG